MDFFLFVFFFLNRYGSMVPIGAVEVGDFPRESDGLDEDDDEI